MSASPRSSNFRGGSRAVYAPGDPNTGVPANDATVTFEYSLPAATTPTAPARAATHHRSMPGEAPIVTATFVDGFGRVTETARDAEVDSGGSPTYAVVASGAVEYDPLGRVIRQGQPQQLAAGATAYFTSVSMTHPTVQRFDAWGRGDLTTFPDGTSTLTAYAIETAGSTSGTTVWLETTTTDTLGRHHEGYTDAAGRTLQVTQHNQIGSAAYWDPTATTPQSTRYAYDPLGRLVQVLDAASPPNVTTVTYDSLGRRTSIDSPDTGLTDYVYDGAGNLAKRITPNLRPLGQSIQNVYDRGRLMSVLYPPLLLDGALIDQPPTIFSYGGPTPDTNHTVGRIASRSDASGLTTFRYGTLGETTHTQQELVDPDDFGAHLGQFDTEYEYDRFGRMRSVTYPNGEHVYYRYNAGGALRRVDYDRSGEYGAYLQEILYDHFGQRTQVTYGNGVVSHFTYTPAMRRLDTLETNQIAESFGGPRSVTAQSLLYGYTLTGNIESLTNNAAGPGVGGATPYVYQSFAYDALDQLRYASGYYSVPTPTSIEDRWHSSSFEYDGLGRMTRNQRSEGAGGYPLPGARDFAYNYPTGPGAPVHAPSHIVDAAAAGLNTIYHWDANGNQTGSEIAGTPGETQIQWDHENRVAQFTSHSGIGVPDGTTRFLYDAGGTRTHKINPGEGTVTLYPNQFTSIRRLNSAGAPAPFYDLTTNHVYAGAERVASNVNSSVYASKFETYWYHGDHLTSANWVTNRAGMITEHLEYYPYGETWIEEAGGGSTSPGTPEAYRYTGKELDGETGLYYFGARYYDPRIAVWASADPILASYLDGSPNGGVWDARNLGLYTYSYNSPVWMRDPDGRQASGVQIIYEGAQAGQVVTPESARTSIQAGIRGANAVGNAPIIRSTPLGRTARVLSNTVQAVYGIPPDGPDDLNLAQRLVCIARVGGDIVGLNASQPQAPGMSMAEPGGGSGDGPPSDPATTSAPQPPAPVSEPAPAGPVPSAPESCAPAVPGNPWSPHEVDRRISEGRRAEGLPANSDRPNPASGPGRDMGGHPARGRTPHSTGERNVSSGEEHSRVHKGSNGMPRRR